LAAIDGGASGVQASVALRLPACQAMIAMPFSRLIAVVLLIATTGCAATPLFSRKDDEDAALDARTGHDRRSDDADASPLNGQWNVIRDANQEPEVAAAARPPITLPVSELLARAMNTLDQQRLPEARQHLEAILRQQPSHPRAHHLLAYISDLEGRWGDAEHHYQLALQSDPHNADIVGDLGYSYMLQGRLPLAEQYLLRARQLDPSHVKAAENLAELYSRRNDMQSAHRVLGDVFPPDRVEQSLARLFPGAPLHATMNPAPASAPQFAANQQFAAGSPNSPQFTPASTNPPERAAPVLTVPGFTSAMPVIPPPATGFMPNLVAHAEARTAGQPAGVRSQYAQLESAAPPPVVVEPASANRVTSAAIAPGAVPASAGVGARRWPPAFWPPESTDAPVTQASGVTTATPPRSTSGGVTYLLPRRLQTPPGNLSPFGALAAPPGNSSPPSAESNPPRPLPQGTMSQFENPAQYATGPGASRIVTWSNRNGQSLESPPLPPTDEELRAAAAMGLSGAAAAPTAPLRTSPGSASGWNGGFYPPPQRQLPGGTASIYDYPQQGAPRRATAPGTSGATGAAAATEPHAGFVIAPETALPANPLAGFEADRRQFDQQHQQQVDQSYAQSPSGFIRPPSESIPVPTYEVPARSQPALSGPPLTSNGTPWPGRSVEGSVPQANAPTAAPEPAANGLVTPLPYRSQRTAAPPVTPPAYRRPTSPAANADPFDDAGPKIIPGPSSW
jgi:Flp pilus assembly protein TadD